MGLPSLAAIRSEVRAKVIARDVLLPEGSWSKGLTEAIKLRDRAEARAPGPADVPPPSTFPMTPAAREALRLARWPIVSKARKRELTHGPDAA